MFTQCPDCKKTYPLDTKPQMGDSMPVYCGNCGKEFDALELLSDNPVGLVAEAKTEFIAKSGIEKKPKAKKKRKLRSQLVNVVDSHVVADEPEKEQEEAIASTSPVQTEALPWEVASHARAYLDWRLGSILGALLLICQLVYFEMDDISQSLFYRPFMERICHGLGCRIQDYKNLNDFEVLNGSFTLTGNNGIKFKAVINNQAPFQQKPPNIKLTLVDSEERIYAQRIFIPSEYLPEKISKSTYIASDESVDVQLNIRAPKIPIGGYYFDLIY